MIAGSHARTSERARAVQRLEALLLEDAALFSRHPHLLVSIFKLFIDYKWSLYFTVSAFFFFFAPLTNNNLSLLRRAEEKKNLLQEI